MDQTIYRKIFKALNEDLNMILSDDDFEEPEIDLGVHIENIHRKIFHDKILALCTTNKNAKELKNIITDWDGENPIFFASDDNIRDVVKFSVKALGNKANLNWIDTSNVTDMRLLFADSKFNGDISKWDVSSVTDMTYMFNNSVFNGDISQWNVSNVQDMTFMFFDSKFDNDISEWDVSSVTNMSYMFEYSKFNGDISKWDVSNVQDMSYMFDSGKFTGDISGWDVSKVINMYCMFFDCPIQERFKPQFKEK